MPMPLTPPADTVPVTVDSRHAWFDEFEPDRRPLWVATDELEAIAGWLSLRSFYGRPAYHATVEIAVYCAPARRRQGFARGLVRHALERAPALGIRTLLAFVFGHNAPSIALFEAFGFGPWGRLPQVAELDGIERDLAIYGRRVA
jgi:phosphinothricin acetyltransferase